MSSQSRGRVWFSQINWGIKRRRDLSLSGESSLTDFSFIHKRPLNFISVFSLFLVSFIECTQTWNEEVYTVVLCESDSQRKSKGMSYWLLPQNPFHCHHLCYMIFFRNWSTGKWDKEREEWYWEWMTGKCTNFIPDSLLLLWLTLISLTSSSTRDLIWISFSH